MEELYRNAFSEVFIILNKLNLRKRVPNSFIKFIQDNRNINYNPNFPDDIIFHPENLMFETKAILSLIYRNYLCSQEEKVKLLKNDEEEIRKKYEVFSENKTVENNSYNVENSINSNMQLVDTTKMNFFKKLFLKIKSIFKKNK